MSPGSLGCGGLSHPPCPESVRLTEPCSPKFEKCGDIIAFRSREPDLGGQLRVEQGENSRSGPHKPFEFGGLPRR